MMKTNVIQLLALMLCAVTTWGMTVPPNMNTALTLEKQKSVSSKLQHHPILNKHKQHMPLAMAIPGYGVAEQVFVGGFSTFLSIYNTVITARILLTWFPQAQGVALLQPVYAITDPYLNLFRGIIPPIFGLDLSPILAFVTLNAATSATAAVGCEMPEFGKKQKLKMQRAFGLK